MLEDIVKRAVAELRAREKARDSALIAARRARILSKQAILLIHNDSSTEASAKIDEARKLLGDIESTVLGHSELMSLEEVQAASDEFAEAFILQALKGKEGFPAPETVGVTLQSYLLGLGDVVGELRREALDGLRVGDQAGAERMLGLMEQIYLSLLSVEDASILLRGLRRKLDVARGVIESTRGELTTEAGRLRLGKSVQKLIERLDKKE